jgi:hypothetical protein
VGGLFNSLLLFVLGPFLFLLVFLAIIFLPVLAIRTAVRWRSLQGRKRTVSCLLVGALAAFAGSFALGFAGVGPSPFDMFVRGFATRVKACADIPAIQDWLATLDPKEYTDQYGGVTEKRFARSEQPACFVRLHSQMAQVQPDASGRLFLRLLWGGGFIGHWGIEIGDKSMKPPPDSESIGYRPLAPGAWVWYEN